MTVSPAVPIAGSDLARDIATHQIETSRKRVMEALLGEMKGPNGSLNSAALKLGRKQPRREASS